VNEQELRAQLAQAIEPYRHLIDALLNDTITPDDFQTDYMATYLGDNTHHEPEVFNVVDRFFADVDAYVDEDRLRDPSLGDIGPEELRELARALLRRAGYDA
jgi:Bacterial self-protective colicin-like immunity